MDVTTMYAPTDPCPSAHRIGRLFAWQHLHPVKCACGRVIRCAWWTPERGHECGRCHRFAESDDVRTAAAL